MDTWIEISYHFHISQIFHVFQPLKIVKAILKIKGHTKTHEFGPRTSWLTQCGELGTRGTEIGKPRELAIGLMRSASLGHWKCKYVLWGLLTIIQISSYIVYQGALFRLPFCKYKRSFFQKLLFICPQIVPISVLTKWIPNDVQLIIYWVVTS